MNAEPNGIERGFVVEVAGTVNSVRPIPASVSIIGRDPASAICLPYDGVSRQHLRVDGTGPSVVVVDENSTNGTWINGERTFGPVLLRHGDTLKLGEVRLRYFDRSSNQFDAESGGFEPTSAGHTPVPAGIWNGGTQPQPSFDGAHFVNQTHNISAFEYPQDETIVGRGPGKVLAIIGSVLVVIGAALFFFTVLAVPIFGERPSWTGLASALGFGLLFLGILGLGFGSSISRASRRQHEKPSAAAGHAIMSVGGGPINAGSGNLNYGGTQFTGSNAGNVAMGDHSIVIGPPPAEVQVSLEMLLKQAEVLLPPDRFDRVRAEIVALQRDMTSSQPNRSDAASHLGSIVETMKQGGAALQAGTGIVESLTKIANWIGPFAGGVIQGLTSLN